MTDISTRVAIVFERHGWEFDLSTGPQIRAATREGVFDPAEFVRLLSSGWLRRNRTKREDVLSALRDQGAGDA